MKKLLALVFCSLLSISIANASVLSNAAKNTANAVKSDVKSTSNSVKNAVKTDINNKVTERTSVAAKKKQAKIDAIDKKIANYNKQLNKLIFTTDKKLH